MEKAITESRRSKSEYMFCLSVCLSVCLSTMEYQSLWELVLVCVGVVVKCTMHQHKVDVDILNPVKSVLTDVSSISPSSEQRQSQQHLSACLPAYLSIHPSIYLPHHCPVIHPNTPPSTVIFVIPPLLPPPALSFGPLWSHLIIFFLVCKSKMQNVE